MDYYKRKKGGNDYLPICHRKGQLQLPLHDLCVERDSKNTYEVAGILQYPSAFAYTLVGCITLFEMQIISLNIN